MKSTRKRISPRQQPLNARTDRWPIGARDPVYDAGADAAVVRDPVVAQLPLLDRAEPFHRPLRPLVQLVGLQPHTVAAELVEEMAKLQVFRFGVRDGAARVAPEEGPADLGRLVRSVDVQEPRAPDRRAVAHAPRDECDLIPERLL